MNGRLKKVIILIVIVLAAAVAFSLYGLVKNHNSKLAYINILVAPSGSSLKLDGKGVKGGLHSVKAGSHNISASKNGFASQTKTVNLQLKQTKFVGIILQSNSAQTKNWYSAHPADNSLVQSINNQVYDQASKDGLAANPLLAKLPYIGAGIHFRIDYGVPAASSKTGLPAVYIRYDSDEAKQDALNWIKSQGSDPASMDIIYISVAPNSLQ